MVEGTPFIEAIEGDPAHCLVTFLWRERAETHKVVVWGGPAGLDHPENNQMTRLLDTDLWYRTYRVQTNVRGIYSFTVDDTVTATGDERADGGLSFLIDPLNPKVSHEDAKADVIMSLLELPEAPPQPWIVPLDVGLGCAVVWPPHACADPASLARSSAYRFRRHCCDGSTHLIRH